MSRNNNNNHQTRSKTATKQRAQEFLEPFSEEEEDHLQQEIRNGAIMQTHAFHMSNMPSPSMPSKGFFIALIGLTMAIIFMSLTEGQFRRVAPESAWRPSTLLTTAANRAEATFLWIGWQLGRFTNIYYWIKDLCVDFAAMIEPLFTLFMAPFYTVKGFVEYYAKAYGSTVSFTGGPLTGVLFSVGLCAIAASIIRHLFFKIDRNRHK